MKKIFTLKFNVSTYYPNQGKPTISEYSESKNQHQFKAPDHCVENILNFARSYKVVESQSTGKVEMNLN